MQELWIHRDNTKFALRSGVFFLLAAHLYRWTASMFTHDSLMVYHIDDAFQISLGRVLIPVYLKLLRGRLTAPLLVAMFGSLFLLLSVLLCLRILRIRRKSAVILCAGLLTTFETLAFDNATFLPWFDIQMLSLLFASLSAYCLTAASFRFRKPLALLCCVISLCLYQGYVEVLSVLILLSLLRDLLEGAQERAVLRAGITSAAVLLLAGLCYLAVILLIWRLTGIRPTGHYNSLGRMQNLLHYSSLGLLWKTWRYPLLYLLRSEIAHRHISAGVYVVLALLTLAAIAVQAGKQKLSGGARILIGLILFVFLPLGSNLVYFLDNGIKHGAMTYSFAFYAVCAVMVFDLLPESASRSAFALCRRYAVPVLCGVLILNHVIFSNQLYLKKDLESQAALSFMTRVVDRMEQTEGYEIGQTRVAFLGQISDNPTALDRAGFHIVNDPMPGTLHHLAVSYYGSYAFYFNNILGYPLRLISLEELKNYIEAPDLQDMPIFPAEGSVRMVGDTLVIRFSEDMRPQELR